LPLLNTIASFFWTVRAVAVSFSVDQHRMIIADGDEPRTYRYVCRTKAENIERELPEYHSRPLRCILLSLWSK
jgi:hypothetical protein